MNFIPAVPGTTFLSLEDANELIPSLTTISELNEWEYENNTRARAWAFSPKEIARANPLTEEYVRTLHHKMFCDTWCWAGRYRQTNLNLGCPFHEIPQQIGVLLGDATYWIEHRTYNVDEIAVRFHHGLVAIHPFSNGNGRHTRMIADVLAVKNGQPEFSWGSRNLRGEQIRETYLAVLQEADRGDIRRLLEFSRS